MASIGISRQKKPEKLPRQIIKEDSTYLMVFSTTMMEQLPILRQVQLSQTTPSLNLLLVSEELETMLPTVTLTPVMDLKTLKQ